MDGMDAGNGDGSCPRLLSCSAHPGNPFHPSLCIKLSITPLLHASLRDAVSRDAMDSDGLDGQGLGFIRSVRRSWSRRSILSTKSIFLYPSLPRRPWRSAAPLLSIPGTAESVESNGTPLRGDATRTNWGKPRHRFRLRCRRPQRRKPAPGGKLVESNGTPLRGDTTGTNWGKRRSRLDIGTQARCPPIAGQTGRTGSDKSDRSDQVRVGGRGRYRNRFRHRETSDRDSGGGLGNRP